MADLVTLSGALGVQTMTEVVRTYDTSATDRMGQDLFKKGRKIPTNGEFAAYDEIQSSRKLAPFVAHGSPAPLRPNQTLVPRVVPLIPVRHARTIPWTRLFLDRAGGEMTDNARAVIADTLQDMTLEAVKSREFAAWRALHGSISIDPAQAGQANGPAKGTDVKVAIAYAVNTLAKSASWATSSTLILSDEIPKIQAAALAASGVPIEQMYFNDLVYRNFLKNDEITAYGKNERWAESFLRADVTKPEVLNGVRVADVVARCNAYGYQDDTAANVKWIDNTKVICLPGDGMLPRVLGWAQGKVATPEDLWGPGNAVGIGVSIPSNGLVAYSERVSNPVGVNIYVADFFCPIVLFPKAVTLFTSE